MEKLSYSGIHNTTPGFTFPTLLEFIETTRMRLQEPLGVPLYAAADEAAMLPAVAETLAKQPYALRGALNEMMKKNDGQYQQEPRPILHQEYPQLYRAALFMTRVTKEFAHIDLLIRLYRAKTPEYQAFVYSYLDKGWIYISEQFFLEPQMLSSPELCFLLGHELGHAQCRHTTIKLLTRQTPGRNGEYSADRCGLIACMKWLLEQAQDTPAEELAAQAVLDCTAMLDKIDVACRKKGTDWRKYDREALEKRFRGWLEAPHKLPPDSATHPATERRALAMHHFSQSRLFYQCLGLPAAEGLLEDQKLREIMGLLRTN